MPRSERLLFIAKPPAEALDAMERAVEQNGLKSRLGPKMFDKRNWHQSLSDRYPCNPITEAGLVRAGKRVKAEPFLLTLNRMRDRASVEPIHWEFQCKGHPKAFEALLAAIQIALLAEGFDMGYGHTPHVTISYRARERLPPTAMSPILWAVEAFMLVKGKVVTGEDGRTRYLYEEVDRWNLESRQPDLFTG